MSTGDDIADTGSLRDWLAHWGAGPNWADATGATVPIAKTSLLALIDEVELLRLRTLPPADGFDKYAALLRRRLRLLARDVVKAKAALREIRLLALDGKPSNLVMASIAAVADDALESAPCDASVNTARAAKESK